MHLKTLFTAASAALVISTSYAETRYDDHRLVHVQLRTPEQLHLLESLGGRILNCRCGVGPLDVVVPPDATARLEEAGIRYELRHSNVQALLDAERQRLQPALAAGGGGIGGGVCADSWFDDYKPLASIEARMDDFATAYPDLVEILTVGTTIEGRTTRAMRITAPTGGPNKPAVLFTSCQHAREWISPMTTMYIATRLLCDAGSSTQIQSLLEQLEFIIVPIVNPDGYEFTWVDDRFWRKNRRDHGGGVFGVDLNRNWDYDWNGGESNSSDPDDPLYVGASAFSEPETQALRDFVIARPQIVSHIDFHSYTQIIIEAWGYTPTPAPNFDIIHDLGTQMSQASLGVNGFSYPNGSPPDLIYMASGILPDWMYGAQGIYSYTIELRPTNPSGGGWELPPDQILPTCEENFAAAMAMANWTTQGLQFTFPQGRPELVETGQATTLGVDITEIVGAVAPGSAMLHARVGNHGPFTATPLTDLGAGSYEGTLPAGPCGEVIEFYVEAQVGAGQSYQSPPGAPSTVHQAGIFDLDPRLDDDFETDLGWTTEVLAGATSGQWERGVPVDDPGWDHDPATDGDGSGQCYLTHNVAGNSDVDGGGVRLVSPELDLTGGDVAVRYDYFLKLTDVTTTDRLQVEIDANGGAGPWIEIAGHAANGGLNWRTYEIAGDEIVAAGATLSATMRLRFTAYDDDPPSIVEAAIDGVQVTIIDCPTVPGDADDDGDVDIDDVIAVVLAWGPCPAPCLEDLDGSGVVDIDDVIIAVLNFDV